MNGVSSPGASALHLRAVRWTPVGVPMRRPLGTSAATIRDAPLVLVDVQTEEGVVGRSYLFCYVPEAAVAIGRLLDAASHTIAGVRVAPLDVSAQLARRFRLLGVTGVVAMAISAIDVACWDALAIAAGAPLAALLGATPKPIPAYNSNGLGLVAPGAAADEALELLDGGFTAIKMRLGRPSLREDVDALRAVRARLPDGVALMVDFNQALSLAEAKERCAAIDGEGVYWIEEPIRHDDYAGSAELAREIGTPVQIGENFAGPHAMASAIVARAADFMMPDLARIGGVSGWLQAAALASAAGVPLSSHLFPEASAHLLAASRTAHWLEYVDWASPILESPLALADGVARIGDAPGTGVRWNEDAVRRFELA